MKAMKANILKIYILTFLGEMYFFLPIMFPLLVRKGLTIQQIFLVEGIYAMICLISEIPLLELV